MKFKLCYKEYDCKISLGAMKRFKEATGKDLWHVLTSFIIEYSERNDESIMKTCSHMYGVCSFDTAANLFYSLAKECNSALTIEEIEDAMFHVGWLPTDRDGDMSEPWPMVMVLLAADVNKYFNEITLKKK